MGLGAEPQTYRGPNGVRRWFDSFDADTHDLPLAYAPEIGELGLG
jgi:hypothetical protein